jgi:hypothetical protein
MTGALEEHHQRDAFSAGDVGDTPAFPAGRRPDRPSECREILGADGNRAAIDATDTGDERIGRRQPGEGADLGERTIVEQDPDAAASIETADLAAPGEFVGATHRVGGGAACREIIQCRVPVPRHGCQA